MNDETKNVAGNETPDETVSTVPESNAEAEQLRMENEELKNAIRMREARDEITRELTSAGARSPGLMFTSVKADIQFDADGKPANVAAIVANLKRTFPEQFGYEQPSASIDGGAGARSNSGFLTREALAKMKPTEIARLDWNDVRQVLSN